MTYHVRRAGVFLVLLPAVAAAIQSRLPHDDCAGAKTIAQLPHTERVDISSFYSSFDEPLCYEAERTAWYRYTPATNERVTIDAAESNFTAHVEIARGTCVDRTVIGSCFGPLHTFTACAGQTYLFQLARRYAYDPGSGEGYSLAFSTRATPGDGDTDADGVNDCADNCPTLANSGQADGDGDGGGDVCDSCPTIPSRPDDYVACQDADGDGVHNASDNCRHSSNADQVDGDGDGVGDGCDNCAATENPAQADRDADGTGDDCDACTDPDGDAFGTPGYPASACPTDNCPLTANPDQRDANQDGVGDACRICSLLGRAARYTLIAASRLKVKARVNYGYIAAGMYVETGRACVGRAALESVEFGSYGSESRFVATASSGTAVRFLAYPSRYRDIPNVVGGDLITGGGSVAGFIERVTGRVDTSGLDPAVAECQGAIADARTASATLAALPPTRSLGSVVIPVGEGYTLDARGGGIFEFDVLRLGGGSRRHYGYAVCGDGASFDVLCNPEDEVILNVNRLEIGNCSYLFLDCGGSDTSRTIVNVPGRGPRIRIGVQADTLFGTKILAPERTLVVEGAATDIATYLGPLWVRNAKILGWTEQYVEDYPFTDHCAP
jgi:hypothetical protein